MLRGELCGEVQQRAHACSVSRKLLAVPLAVPCSSACGPPSQSPFAPARALLKHTACGKRIPASSPCQQQGPLHACTALLTLLHTFWKDPVLGLGG
jgi:hypothetical protein